MKLVDMNCLDCETAQQILLNQITELSKLVADDSETFLILQVICGKSQVVEGRNLIFRYMSKELCLDCIEIKDHKKILVKIDFKTSKILDDYVIQTEE